MQAKPTYYASLLSFDKLRAGLHYGEEVHQSVKNFSLEQGYLKGGHTWWKIGSFPL